LLIDAPYLAGLAAGEYAGAEPSETFHKGSVVAQYGSIAGSVAASVGSKGGLGLSLVANYAAFTYLEGINTRISEKEVETVYDDLKEQGADKYPIRYVPESSIEELSP
jgi:hypothetical protein